MNDLYPTEAELQAKLPPGLVYRQGYPHSISCPCGDSIEWAGSPHFINGEWISLHALHSNDSSKLAQERAAAEPYVLRERRRIMGMLNELVHRLGEQK